MTFSTQAHTALTSHAITLASQKPETLAQFYQTVFGFQVHSHTLDDQEVYSLNILGDDPLVHIQAIADHQTDSKEVNQALYHMAFLLPQEKDLATLLHHLIAIGIPLEGGADHGYSQAIYFHDPEGNGIECYWDKPVDQWEILEDGQIVGVTEALDIDRLLVMADSQFTHFPSGTSLGHFHLSVKDLPTMTHFYQEGMGLGLKYSFGPYANFMASGNYHHHIALNRWNPQASHTISTQAPGLVALHWHATHQDIEWLKNHLQDFHVTFLETEADLTFLDPMGVQHRITVVG